MQNKFFTFIRPYLLFIDNGHLYRKPFSWLYVVFAFLNLALPLYILYTAADNNLFNANGKVVFTFLLIWLIIAFASWVSFQLWWDRRGKVTATSVAGDDFVATPVFAHLIQTLGEWMGTWIGMVGFAIVLVASIILGDEAMYLSRGMGIPFLGDGILLSFLFPVYGFLIIVFARFLAEQFRALSSIANNTRKG